MTVRFLGLVQHVSSGQPQSPCLPVQQAAASSTAAPSRLMGIWKSNQNRSQQSHGLVAYRLESFPPRSEAGRCLYFSRPELALVRTQQVTGGEFVIIHFRVITGMLKQLRLFVDVDASIKTVSQEFNLTHNISFR